MYAYEIPGMRFSLPAGGSVARHRFVAVAEGSVAKEADSLTSVVGVSMNEITADDFAAHECIVEIADGLVMVEAAEAIAAGAAVGVGAGGKAIADATGASTVVAITGATGAGQLITVKI